VQLSGRQSFVVAVVVAAMTAACAAGSKSAAVDAPQHSQAPTSAASTSAGSSSIVSPSSSAATPAVPSSAPGSATLDYVSSSGNSRPPVRKTVVGPTYQRLAADLAALKPVPPGTASCNVLTAEVATITLASAGHTKVFIVEGSPCRGVRLSVDGVAQPLLAGSMTLLAQVRAIAGTSGMAHPLSGS
jgi:hypothetical protein